MTKVLLAIFLTIALSFGLNAKTNTVDFKTNITCQNCADKIQSGLEGVDGLNKTTIDVATKTVSLSYDDSKIQEADLISKINVIGFTASTDMASSSDKAACDPSSCATDKKAKKCGTKKNCCTSKKK